MKKIISSILAMIISISCCPIVSLANDQKTQDTTQQYNDIVQKYDKDKDFLDSMILTVGSNEIELNGKNLKEQTKVKEKNETAMVSVNTLCKYIDAQYTQPSELTTGCSTIKYEDSTIWFNETTGAMDISSKDNDEIIVLDETPYKQNEELMVPLESFAQAIGFDVKEKELDSDTHYLLTKPYQTKRLIVSTKKHKIDDCDAVESVRDSENDLTILQYETEDEAKQAEEILKTQNSIESVEADEIFSTSAVDDTDNDLPVSTDATLLETFDDHLDTSASEVIHIDDMNDYLQTQPLDDVIVAVVDTGVCSTHEALKDRIICADVNFSDDTEQTNSEDNQGHGTHVTGIIASNTLDNVKILDVKAMNKDRTGTLYNVYEAMQYSVEQGAKVINLSLGKYGSSDLMTNYVKELWDKNISVIASAGNNQWFVNEFTPAGIKECITVGACTTDLKIADFSNGGYPADIVAPGVNIYSTYLYNDQYDGYRYLTVTSMSAPFVTAAAIMMYSYDGSYTAEYVHNRIHYNGQKWDCSWYNHGNSSLVDGDWYIDALCCSNLIDVPRTSLAKCETKAGYYSQETLDISFTCDDPNAQIYYTIDGTRASKENGILYTKPFTIDSIHRIHFVSYSKGKEKSIQQHLDFYLVMKYDESNFEITDDGIITSCDYDKEKSAYMWIPDTINGITVTGIGKNLFYQNSDIRAILLPDTCTYIGTDAFYYCVNLATVTGRNVEKISTEAFYGCWKLESIDFNNLKTISPYSFTNCNKLKEFKNEYITHVPQSAFFDCYGLTVFDVPNVTLIDEEGLAYCTNIESFNFPKLKTIGDRALYNVSAEYIELPELVEMGEYAFGYSNMINVKLNKYVGDIKEGTFNGCDKLQYVDIPHAQNIKDRAFLDCRNLKEVVFDEVKTVDDYCFGRCTNVSNFQLNNATIVKSVPSGMETLYLPNCTTFGFVDSNTIKYIYLPKVVKTIGSIQASNLEYAYLPELEKIDKEHSAYDLFLDCFKLEEINLPKLTSIANNCSIYGLSDSKANKNDQYNVKRINTPSLNKDVAQACRFINVKSYYATNLPNTCEGGSLNVDVAGSNLQFEWYYSPTGKKGTFKKLDAPSEMSYQPTQNGYYYVNSIDYPNAYSKEYPYDFQSNVCQYTCKEDEISNNLVKVNSPIDFSMVINNETINANKLGSAYYINQSIPQGSTVNIVCDNTAFDSLLDNNGRICSTDNNYSFVVSNDIRLNIQTKSPKTVSFYNENNKLISSKKYDTFKQSDYPQSPQLYGYEFIGWSKTVEQINEELSQGKFVDVKAQFKEKLKYYSLKIYGGKVISTTSDDDNGKDSYREFSKVTVEATINDTCTFKYWIDSNNNILSYSKQYTFYMSSNMVINAVYGEPENIVTTQATTRITNAVIDKQNNQINFIAERYVPSDYKVLQHGIILSDNLDYVENSNDFVIGAEDVLKGTSIKNSNSGTYTLYKSSLNDGDIWLAKSYVTYQDRQTGKVYTKYSNMVISEFA